MQTTFLNELCNVHFSTYKSTGRVAIYLTTAETGEPMATATVNAGNVPLEDSEVIIKDYNENAGMLKALKKAGVLLDTGKRAFLGHAEGCIAKLTEESLNEL